MDVFSPAYVPAFEIAPLAPAEAPSSSGGSGPGLGARIDVDWSASKRNGEAKVRQERRSAVERARHSVEAGWSRPGQLTKAERLAAAKSTGRRETGGLAERRATAGSVAKAIAAVADVPSDTDISDAEFRYIREILRQRYPGAKLSAMLAEGARMEQMLINDPVAAREHLIAAYSRTPPSKAFAEPERAHGIRGSVARAKQDQEDSEDLKDWIAKFGKRLPSILAELEFVDRELRRDVAGASAKMAVRYGAPAVESEIEPYKARMAQKEQAAHVERLSQQRIKGVQLAIYHGLIPGDAETLNEIAEVLLHPQFQKHPTDALESLRRAAAIARHPEHVWKTGKRAAKRADAGSKSIGGGSPSAGHVAPRGTGGVRDSVNRAFGV